MGLKPDSKAPATRSSRGGESFLSSPARSLTGLSSLPRQGFEGLQGPPTCAAGAGSGVSSGTGREEREESGMGEKCSSLQVMPKWGNWRGSCKPPSPRMVTKSRGHPGAGDIQGLEHCGTCHPTDLLVVLNCCKVFSPGSLKEVPELFGMEAEVLPVALPGFWGVFGFEGSAFCPGLCCGESKSVLYRLQRWSLVLTGSKLSVLWGRVRAPYHPLLQHSLSPPSPKSFLLFLALCDFVDNSPGHGVMVMEGDANVSRGWGWERAQRVLSHPTQVCPKMLLITLLCQAWASWEPWEATRL